ncbi:MAG: DUF177 domain-containing protein [Lachnospiraceae bacterium]|nr:DUF177 domain-containing protein [Lachnospiraceae bacterium]
MKVDLKEFLEKEDVTLEKEVAIDIRDVTVAGVGHSRKDDDPITLTFYNSEGKNLYISGKTKLSFEASCDRCLEDVDVEVPIALSADIGISDDVFSMDNDEGLDYIEDGYLDVDGMIMAEVHLGWPSKILCKDDCLGLCPVCGKNRNLVACDCDTQVRDPRMMQFLDVFNSSKEV